MNFILFVVISFICFINKSNGRKRNAFRNPDVEQRREDKNHKPILDEFLVFFDEDCLESKDTTGRDVIHEFLNEYKCYKINQKKTKKFRKIGDYWIVVNRKKKCKDSDQVEVEWSDYCITEIDENEMEEITSGVCKSRNVEAALWNLNVVSPRINNGLQYIEYPSTFNPNIEIIVMDSGIDSAHSEFSGISYKRIFDEYPGENLMSHGTHVAATIVGKTYGIFRATSTTIKLIDVRVFPSVGGTSSDVILNGYDAIINRLQAAGSARAIINLSLGGGNSNEKNARLASIRAEGGIIICSAGNDDIDASGKSPASSPDTITVGNHESDNERRASSNFGDLVDIWAPGTSIKSAIPGGGSGYKTGTSMSSPLVAGIALNIFVENNDFSFDEMRNALLNEAEYNINDNLGNYNLPSVRSSCIAYTDPHCGMVTDDTATYPVMTCGGQSSYENEYDGEHTMSLGSNFINGQYSEHDNSREDRRFKWEWCRPTSDTTPQDLDINLVQTKYDEAWKRGCGGNTALMYAYSTHDNNREDRIWDFKCSTLDSKFRLTDCGWSDFLNEWDAVLDYNCAEDGVVRTIYSEHSNSKEDRRWKFECCRMADSTYTYPSMTCGQQSDYDNVYDGMHELSLGSNFINGQYSVHDNSRQDRRFKWKWCKPSGVSSVYTSTVQLDRTDYDEEFVRSCSCINDGHAALTYAYSTHDNNKEDRIWTFKCGKIHSSYKLVNCGYSGYLNNYDGVLDYNCPQNGVVRSIWSKHLNSKEDRIWSFECCQIAHASSVSTAKISRTPRLDRIPNINSPNEFDDDYDYDYDDRIPNSPNSPNGDDYNKYYLVITSILIIIGFGVLILNMYICCTYKKNHENQQYWNAKNIDSDTEFIHSDATPLNI